MINRVTTMGPSRTMLWDLQRSQRAMQQTKRHISSGKKLQTVSDGPAEAVTALDYRADLRRNEQLQKNRDRAQEWLQIGDTSLTQVDNSLESARSLLIQANSGALDANARKAVADQIRAVRIDVLAQAQSKHLGRPIFGGTVAGDAYDDAGTYLGDTGSVRVPLTPTVTSQVTRTGPEVFGTNNPADPTSGDVFQLLEHLANAVEAGDTVAMTAGVSLLDGTKSVVQRNLAELGARLRQLEDLDAGAKIRKDELKESISELEDVDVAEAYMEMAAREAAYQGAVAVAAKVIQPSLLDFLR